MDFNLVPTIINNLKTIKFIGRKLERQSAYARGNKAIETSETDRKSWTFVLPDDFSETINHSWDPYDSIVSRLADKVGQLTKNVGEIKGLGAAGSGALKSIGSGDYKNIVSSSLSGIKNSDIPSYRIDSSLMYKDTNRREYSFTFKITDFSGDPYNNVFLPVRELEKCSCAEISGELTDINFPYIFKVFTTDSDLLKINNAAINSVSPVWSGPYVNNYHIHCNLTINIIDLEPLYRSNFERGGIIRTS